MWKLSRRVPSKDVLNINFKQYSTKTRNILAKLIIK